MAYAESQPVKEIPGFARIGEALRRQARKVLDPIYGPPGNPTKFGKISNFFLEASDYGLMAGPAAFPARMRFAAHPVRGTRIVDSRFLGSETRRLAGTPSKTVAPPKTMFSNSPGDLLMVTNEGRVVLPREADVRLYRSERVKLPGGKSIALNEVPGLASDLDASTMSAAAKSAEVARINQAATPYWMYWMYEKDVADANATLAKYRAGSRYYDNKGIREYDVLPKGAAATVVSSPLGTKFTMGESTFSPNHVSAMSRDRFVKDPRLFDVYNDGYLPFQSMTFMADPKVVKGKKITPVMRVTDHHEKIRSADGTLVYGADRRLPHAEFRTHDRTYYIGREIPYYGVWPENQGGVDLMYKLENREPVIRANGAYSASVAVQQASKGGDSPHKNFRNFLASDKVPESIFGYRVVQRTEDYTPEDVEFFKENPKAAGFYDLGNGVDGEVPQQAAGKGTGRTARRQPSQSRPKDSVNEPESLKIVQANPTLFNHVKKHETLRLGPYPDNVGFAIGYGAHTGYDGKKVTEVTPAITQEQAEAMLARDLYARREALKATLPNWQYMPAAAKQAFLDVSMGRDDILDDADGRRLYSDLEAAGNDPEKLLTVAKKHYYSYRGASGNPEKGLMDRRIAGGKLFFNEDFSYEGKVWDPERGFVPEGGK